MKKAVALVLVLILCTSVFGACSKTTSSVKENSGESSNVTEKNDTKKSNEENVEESNYTEPGTFPIVKNQITLSILAHPTPEKKVDSYDAEDGNIFAKWYEEKTNIKFDFVMTPSADEISSTISTLMSTNDLPDIVMSNNFTPEQQMLYGSEGILLEIGDLVEKYAPRIKAYWDNHPEVKEAVTLPGGKIYAINYSSPKNHSISWNKMYVYKPWLDKLNLPIPATTEEFYKTLVAFRDNDPNGNGKKDEIPLMGNNSWVAWNPIVYLIDPFEYNENGRNIFVNDEGKVYAAYVQDGYKEGLRYINKLYTEGLIAPETFTVNDMATFKNVLNQEPCVIGFLPTHAPFTATDIYKDDYVMVPPLKGPDGTTNTTYNTGLISTTGVVLSSNCKDPIAAIRVLDGIFDPEVGVRAFNGVEGSEWEYAKEGALNKNGGKAIFKGLTNNPDYTQDKLAPNATWPMTMYLRGDNGEAELTFEYDAENPKPEDKLTSDTIENYLPYAPEDSRFLPRNLIVPEDKAPEIADLQTILYDTVNSYSMRFILGELDVDKDWDTYLNELKSVGLENYLKIYQDCYDSMK